MELNHKRYNIYGEGNKSVRINNPKETQILINDEPNGATLHDVCKGIEDLGTNKIYAWSILEYYTPQDGYLVDNEGNRISLLEGETKIFFKGIEDPVMIENEKEVTLEHVRLVSALIGLGTIEETIIGLSNEDKQLLVEERMDANEKRQKQIQKEKADADAREKQKLEEERIQLEKEQAEEQERLDQLERERIEEEKKKEEEEERLRIEAEEQKKIDDEKKQIELEEKKKRKQLEDEQKEKEEEEKRQKAELKKKEKEEEEERERIEAEIKRKKKERAENENVYSPKDFKEVRETYVKNGFLEYLTSDEKYSFFFNEEVEGNEPPFVVLKTSEDYEELVGGKLTVNNEKIAEYEFAHEGVDKIIVLNKKTDTIKIRVLA